MKYIFNFLFCAVVMTAGFSFIHDEYIKLRPIKVDLILTEASAFIDITAWEKKLIDGFQDPTLEYSIASLYQKVQTNPLVKVTHIKWTWDAGYTVFMEPLNPIGVLLQESDPDNSESLLLFSNLKTIWVNTQEHQGIIASLPNIHTNLFGAKQHFQSLLIASIPENLSAIKQSKLAVENIYISDWGHWTLQLDDQSEVILGSEHITQRLALINQVQPDLLCTSSAFDSVDMRYDSAFALHCKT